MPDKHDDIRKRLKEAENYVGASPEQKIRHDNDVVNAIMTVQTSLVVLDKVLNDEDITTELSHRAMLFSEQAQTMLRGLERIISNAQDSYAKLS